MAAESLPADTKARMSMLKQLHKRSKVADQEGGCSSDKTVAENERAGNQDSEDLSATE